MKNNDEAIFYLVQIGEMNSFVIHIMIYSYHHRAALKNPVAIDWEEVLVDREYLYKLHLFW